MQWGPSNLNPTATIEEQKFYKVQPATSTIFLQRTLWLIWIMVGWITKGQGLFKKVVYVASGFFVKLLHLDDSLGLRSGGSRCTGAYDGRCASDTRLISHHVLHGNLSSQTQSNLGFGYED